MFLSLLLGALLYVFIQFLWYSPLLFGTAWIAWKEKVPDGFGSELPQSNGLPAGIPAILVPALLMSVAINTLYVVLARLGPEVYFGAVWGLFSLTVIKKYGGWRQATPPLRRLWYISDGALLVSLITLAFLVFFLQNGVY